MGWLNQLSGLGTMFQGTFDNVWDNISPGLPFIGDAKQFNYQKRLQQKIFDREDNAVQRRVADLRAAGLSPTLAAGSAAGSGTPVSVSRPDYLNDMLKMMSYKQSQETIKQTQAQTSLLKAQEQKIYPEIQHIKSQAKQADSAAYLNYKAAAQKALETYISDYDLKKAQAAGLPYKSSAPGSMVKDALGGITKGAKVIKKGFMDASGAIDNQIKNVIQQLPSYGQYPDNNPLSP